MIKFRIFGFGRNEATAKAPSSVQATQAVVASETPPPNANGKRVLIVDDDPVFLKATAAKLQSAGCRVTTAQESAAAITSLNEQPADAILLDIEFEPDVSNGGMVSWDGFQLMTWLRGNPSAQGARFIMVSNTDSPSNRERAAKLGAVGYLQKPLDHNRLFALVNGGN
jgi:two-component system cell cycle sensor histidine kinase/response regulator CckA